MVFEKIREILMEQLDVEESIVTMEASILEDLGADSLDIVDLVMTLEDEFDMEIPDEEIETIKKYAFAVNEQLKAFWSECGVTLVDFKLEFGKVADGSIVLADEISPDTCRLWDSKTGEKLDKDRFRRDMGGVEDAYAEVMKRLSSHI